MRNKTMFLMLVLLLSSALLSACGTSLAAQPVLAQGTEPAKRTINVTVQVKLPSAPTSPMYRSGCTQKAPMQQKLWRLTPANLKKWWML